MEDHWGDHLLGQSQEGWLKEWKRNKGFIRLFFCGKYFIKNLSSSDTLYKLYRVV